MKITINHLGQQSEICDDDVVDICDALDLMEKGLQGVGFDQKRIEGAIVVRAKQITGDWE